MIKADTIPDALKEGEKWPLLTLDWDWVWLARDGDRVCGMLIAANCHGMAYIMRVKMLPSAPRWALGRLLRQFIRDIRRRGCLGYFTTLNVTEELSEQQLVRIAYRAGANVIPAGVYVAGSTDIKGHG